MLKEQVPTKKMQAKIDELYRRYPNGLVANIQRGKAPKRIKELAKHLAKYVVSPPISVRRIVSYDGQRVKYWYMELSMTKWRGSSQDIMHEIREEEARMLGSYKTCYYNYRCQYDDL